MKRIKQNPKKQRRTNVKHVGKAMFRPPKKRSYSEEQKKQAIKLYMEGNNSRAVGRFLGIREKMCLYWILKYAKNIEPKVVPNARLNVIEMDELYSFVQRKKNLLDNAGH